MQLVVTNQSNQNHNKTISAGPGWAGSASNCQKGKNMKQNRKRKETEPVLDGPVPHQIVRKERI